MDFYNFWKTISPRSQDSQSEFQNRAKIFVADFDVIGVGSLREQQLKNLMQNNTVVLVLHPRMIPESVSEIYEAEVTSFKKRFPQIQIQEQEQFNFEAAQTQLFQNIFPLTIESLGQISARIQEAYQKEVAWDGWLLIDYWRYFVGFLRSRFPDQKDLISLVHWEWVHAWVQVQPFSFEYFENEGHIELNPSLQTVIISADLSNLNMNKGLYGVWYSEKEQRVISQGLNLTQALFLDLLNGERRYTKPQLVDMAKLHLESTKKQSVSDESLLENLEQLFNNGLLKAGTVN